MKRLNISLLVLLIVGSAVFAGGSYGLWKWQMKRHSHHALDRAETAYDEGEMADALDDLERYLGLNPNDDEQFVRLAMWRSEWLRDGGTIQPAAVLNSLSRAVDVDENNLEVRREAAEFCMQYGEWQNAVAHWKKIIELEGGDGSAESRVSLAECYLRSVLTNRGDEVRKLLEPMIGFNAQEGTLDDQAATAPHSVQAYALLASLISEDRDDLATADRIIRGAVRRNPNSAEAYLALSNYLLQNDGADVGSQAREARRDEVIATAKRAYELDSENPDIILSAANVARFEGNLPEAERILSAGLAGNPDDLRYYMQLADVLSQQGKAQEALDLIEQGMLKMSDRLALVNMQFTLQIQLGQADAAELTLEKLKKLNASSEIRLYYQGEVAFAKRDFAQARKHYEAVRPSLSRFQNQAILNTLDSRLLVCYDVLSLPDLQVSTILRMAQANNSPDFLRMEALARQNLGQQERAEAILDFLMRMEGFDELSTASLVREQALRLKYGRQLRLPEETRNWSQVNELLENVAPADTENLGMLALRYSILRARGDTETADDLLTQTRAAHPENLQWWLMQVEQLSADESPETALEELARIEAELGDSPAVRSMRASMFVAIGGEQVQEKLLELERGVEDWSDAEKATLWNQLAAANLRINNWRQSLDLYERVIQLQPQSLDIRMRMFDIALQMEDEASMVSTLGLIEKLVGNDDSNWRLQEARRQLWLHGSREGGPEALAKARRLADQVHIERPQWHANALLRAHIALLDNNNDAAIGHFEESLNNGPRNLGVLQQLAELLIQENRISDASEWLNSVGEDELNDSLLQVQLALDALQVDEEETEKIAALRTRVEELVPADSDDPNQILFRARMLNGLHDLEGAEASYRRAVELAPVSPEPWLQLVGFLVGEGRMEEAEQSVAEAQMRLPETDVPLALGQMHRMLRNYFWAEMYYKMAYAANPESTSAQRTIAMFYLAANRSDRAAPYLNQILQSVDPDAETRSSDAVWARRVAAEILAGQSSYQNYLTAVKLIQENALPDGTLEDQDIMLLSTLALDREEARSRREARDLIEARLERSEPTPDGLKLNLAKLYYSLNDTVKSRRYTEDLLTNYRDNEEILVFYLEILWDLKEYAEMNRRIAVLGPDSSNYIQWQSLVWAETGRLREAIELVKEGFFPKGYEIEAYTTDEELVNYLRGTLHFARLGRYDEAQFDLAEQLLRRYVEKDPNNSLLLASYLGERGGAQNLAEAFEILQEVRGTLVTTNNVTQVALAILRANQEEAPPSSAYYDLVDSWFQVGEQESPDNYSLVLQRASFEELRGDFTAALQHYRRSLKMGEVDFRRQALVQNNMAYLMALNGDCQEPLELVTKAIDSMGPISTLLDTRAMTYITCRQAQMAIADLNRALLDGPNSILLYHLALAQDLARNDIEAKNKLIEALELGLEPHMILQPEQERLSELMKKYDVDYEDIEVTEDRG